MKRVLTASVSLLCTGFVVPALAGEHHEAQAQLHKPAPDFELTDVYGKTHKLSDQKGKVVVLEWTCCNCPFVMRHQQKQKTMQKTFAKFKGKDVVWFAIDSTKPDHKGSYTDKMIKSWIERDDVKLPYPVLRDADGRVGHLYGAKSTPHMFVIDKNGVLVYQGSIDDDPAGNKEHPTNFVEAAVTAVLEGSTVQVDHHPQYGCSVKYAGK